MSLETLGYYPALAQYRKSHHLDQFEVGRVIIAHRERYTLKNDDGEYEGEIVGNFRYSATSKSDFPAVGDWVAFTIYDDNKVLIHEVFPRKTILERQAVGKFGEKQIIATNIDCALIVQAVNRDFNINRLERYITICHASKVEPIVILNKIDLIKEVELEQLVLRIGNRIKEIPLIPFSNKTFTGLENLKNYLKFGKTFCLLGSSGVGKSTLINNLMGKEVMATGEISVYIDRGKHVTTHRELIVTDSGILIDNPGMREVGITDSIEGLSATFYLIENYAKECKFSDCSHTKEFQCAVIFALDNGDIPIEAYENYLKMQRERDHFEMSTAEKRKKDRAFGKMIRTFKNVKNRKNR